MAFTAGFVVLFLLALVPLAQAGTEESPELADAPNDQAVQARAVRETDLLAAWWVVNEDLVNVTLKVAALEPTSTVWYRVWWNRSDDSEFSEMVFTAEMAGDGRIRGDSECVRPNGTKQACFWGPTATFGSPGYVHWENPRSLMAMKNEAVFHNFSAQSWFSAHWSTAPFEGDVAFSDAKLEIAGQGPRGLRIGPFPDLPSTQPPTGAPRFEDEADSVPAVGDIRGMWFYHDAEDVVAAIEVPTLSQETIEGCFDWRGSLDMYDYNTEQRLIMQWVIQRHRVAFDENMDYENWSFYTRLYGGPQDGNMDSPGNVGFVMGSPGFIRADMPRVVWGPADLSWSQLFRVEIACNGATDTYHYQKENPLAPNLGVSSILVVALVAAAIVRRRRRP